MEMTIMFRNWSIGFTLKKAIFAVQNINRYCNDFG